MKPILSAVLLAAAAACATPTGADAVRRFDDFETATAISDVIRFDRVHIGAIAPSEELLERLDEPHLTLISRTREGFVISKRDVEAKIEDLREDLARDLSRVATLADAPGPGVLTVDVVLGELSPNRPTLGTTRRNPNIDLRSFGVGSAEVTVTLSEDGRTLAVIEDSNRYYDIRDPGIGAGIWSTADQFFDQLAGKLADLLA